MLISNGVHNKNIFALGQNFTPSLICPQEDLNLCLRLRRPTLYPLSYGDISEGAGCHRLLRREILYPFNYEGLFLIINKPPDLSRGRYSKTITETSRQLIK